MPWHLPTPSSAHGAVPSRVKARPRPSAWKKRQPRLPHERDQSLDSQDSPPREKMRQARGDLDRGLVDTDKGPELDRVYRRNFDPGKG